MEGEEDKESPEDWADTVSQGHVADHIVLRRFRGNKKYCFSFFSFQKGKFPVLDRLNTFDTGNYRKLNV